MTAEMKTGAPPYMLTRLLHPDASDVLLIKETEHQILSLREKLVRGDENLKAWHLLNAVPYWAETEAIAEARDEQRQMVLHAIDPDEYATYYGSNPHDRPMEQQYHCDPPLTVENAHEIFPRLGTARAWLDEIQDPRIIDLSGNDGLMAANLADGGWVNVEIIDLDPRCVARAHERGIAATLGNFMDAIHTPTTRHEPEFDVAILFETLEHLPDPVAGVKAALEYAPVLYLSTPFAAVERLNLPNWAHVERKGHLHAFLPHDVRRTVAEAGGHIDKAEIGADAVLVFKVLRVAH